MARSISRRRLFGTLGAGAVAATLASRGQGSVAFAAVALPSSYQETAAPQGPDNAFVLPPLPYAYEALEPTIDAETMRFHHDAHHAEYVLQMNNLLGPYPELRAKGIVYILSHLEEVPAAIRNRVRDNGGGHLNHSIFWTIMGPQGSREPTGALATAINSVYGNFATLRAHMIEAGITRFGSGWSWLTLNPSGKLEVINRLNQDSPVMDGYVPLVGVDVWEHSYYLRYRNRRRDYLISWFNVVNWDEVGRRYDAFKF